MDESLADPQPIRRLGDFEIVRELGRGGMGFVYEARQVSLNRKVALKVLSGSLGLTTKAILRFQREAEAAAKLHHTNIVPIYATGEQDGAHYYAMELIEGPGLDQVISQMRAMQKSAAQENAPGAASPSAGTASGTPGPVDWVSRTMNFPPPDAAAGTTSDTHSSSSSSLTSGTGYFDTVARMVAEVADALDYAHAQGVIHRDIKPSNLLLSPVGRLSLNDFGLARMLEQPGMTVSGEFVGSPMYMSPEQIAVGRAPLDHRTDIYSLGATLYELLTLQPPFPGVRRDQVIAQIIGKEPKPPRSINRKVPPDLETICLKMMEKDPDKRYQTAGSVAEDLRRHVKRFAISARRIGPVGRVVRWAKRNRATAAALCGLLLLGLLAGAFAYREHRGQQQAREERRQHAIERAMLIAMSGDLDGAENAIAEAEVLGASPGSVHMVRGQLALHRGDARKAIEHLEQAVKLLPHSVAAYSLLAQAHAWAGQGDRCELIFRDYIEKLTAVTPEDYLFKGLVESGGDPARGLEDLNEAIRRRDSPIARVLRADARTSFALATGNVHMAQSAIDDAYVAKAMMPGNAMVIGTELGAHLVATGVFRDAGEKDRADASLLQAGRDAQELERFPAFPWSYGARWHYLNLTRQEEAAHKVARKGYQEAENAVTRRIYVESLYERGEFEKALEVIERVGDAGEVASRDAKLAGGVYWMRPIVLAELPDGPSRALQAYRENSELFAEGYFVIFNQATLLLLGRRTDAMAASRELRKHPERLSGLAHYLQILDYCGGVISAEEFLKAEAGSRWSLCEAHFYVALDRLSQGDRAGAREHFQKDVATGVFASTEYQWSRLFLKRMDRDPNWPSWIPLQEPTTQPTTTP
jgi:serine/threonine protein kinase/tetratricopeptide (TPR) repeat protein